MNEQHWLYGAAKNFQSYLQYRHVVAEAFRNEQLYWRQARNCIWVVANMLAWTAIICPAVAFFGAMICLKTNPVFLAELLREILKEFQQQPVEHAVAILRWLAVPVIAASATITAAGTFIHLVAGIPVMGYRNHFRQYIARRLKAAREEINQSAHLETEPVNPH
jgi:choline-glycine betaine transporter